MISGSTPGLAQEVSVPDPGLNAAIRAALPKPEGVLTAEDLLSLTSLDAASRNITNLQGLEGASNLGTLNLSSNDLSVLVLPPGLTNLKVLNLQGNSISSVVLPADFNALQTLLLDGNPLTVLALAEGLAR